MIKGIEIIIRNGINDKINAFIHVDAKICYINDKKYIIDKSVIDRILDILALWKNEYGSSSVVDSEEFEVNIYLSDGVQRYHGKGIFPNNYNNLLDIIGDVVNE